MLWFIYLNWNVVIMLILRSLFFNWLWFFVILFFLKLETVTWSSIIICINRIEWIVFIRNLWSFKNLNFFILLLRLEKVCVSFSSENRLFWLNWFCRYLLWNLRLIFKLSHHPLLSCWSQTFSDIWLTLRVLLEWLLDCICLFCLACGGLPILCGLWT